MSRFVLGAIGIHHSTYCDRKWLIFVKPYIGFQLAILTRIGNTHAQIESSLGNKDTEYTGTYVTVVKCLQTDFGYICILTNRVIDATDSGFITDDPDDKTD